MMPPRLQCLNAVRVFKLECHSKAAFSTTTAQPYADRPAPPPPSRASSLASIGDDFSDQNPIRIPQRQRTGRAPIQAGNSAATSRVLQLIQRAKENEAASRAAKPSSSTPALSTADEVAQHRMATNLTRQIARRWKAGDVYAPHDLSSVEMEKWKRRGTPEVDALDVLDLDPIAEYKNFSIMSEFMTPMGRIMHGSQTGLRPVNQRRMAKALRRSIGLGLMPSVHRHPEILRKEMMRRNEQMSRITRGP